MERISVVKSLFLMLFMAAALAAGGQVQRRVPATPHPIEVMQPDSTSLTIRLHGDERGHFTTTSDGYTIVQNKKGYYCYARVGCKGQFVATCRVARNAEGRSRSDMRYLEKMRRDPRLYREL